MKKRYLLPVFVVAGLVSLASAECNVGTNGTTSCCWWSETSCWGVGGQYDDMKTEQQCRDNYGYPGSSCTAPVQALGCCKWAPDTECWTINSGPDNAGVDGEAKVGFCKSGSNVFWNGSCPADGACPTGSPVYDGSAKQALGCCKWETETGCYTIWEGEDPTDGIDGSQKVVDCQGGSNQFWSGRCPSEGTCPSGPAPIQKVQPGIAGLVVVPHGRALHISSPRDASVTLYDLSGNRVFGGKVRAGNSVFSLISQAPGVYYAVVQSGSLTQTANVVLK